MFVVLPVVTDDVVVRPGVQLLTSVSLLVSVLLVDKSSARFWLIQQFPSRSLVTQYFLLSLVSVSCAVSLMLALLQIVLVICCIWVIPLKVAVLPG